MGGARARRGIRHPGCLHSNGDPCSFAFATNENGIIFHGYPIDHDVEAVVRKAR
jgi:hypothetical protein